MEGDAQKNIDAWIANRGCKHGRKTRDTLSKTEQTMVQDWSDGLIPAVKVNKYCRAFTGDSFW